MKLIKMKKFKEAMPPGTMPKEMDVAIRRLEQGEDPEKIEEDMGDVLGDFFGGLTVGRSQNDAIRIEEIGDGGAFAQKFGVHADAEIPSGRPAGRRGDQQPYGARNSSTAGRDMPASPGRPGAGVNRRRHAGTWPASVHAGVAIARPCNRGDGNPRRG